MKSVSTLTAATILVAMATSLRAEPQPPAVATVAAGNVALASGGATITGAFLAEWPGSVLIDGNTTDYNRGKGYAASTLPSSWVVTLPRTYLLSEIRLLLYDKDDRFYRYVVETSLDGKTYHTAADRSQGKWQSWQKLTFEPRPARYIRLRGLYGSANTHMHAVELEAYCKPIAPDYPKFTWVSNFGRIGQLNPARAGVYFRLVGGQTAMEPRSGYYFVDKGHPTFQAMYDLLYRAAKERWEVKARTESNLNDKGYAVVEQLIVNFPADAPSPEVAGGSPTAPPPVCSGGPRLEMGSYGLPCERRPTTDKFQETSVHHVTFKRPFAAPPRILLSPRGLAIYSGANTRGTFFQLHTRNVSKEGFDLVIQGAYARSFSSATVDWIAVGS